MRLVWRQRRPPPPSRGAGACSSTWNTGAGAHRPDGQAELDALDRLAATGDVTVEVRPPLSDAALAKHLGRLHVAVLPYRFGSHSGWLEACRDAGTTVVAPDCGFYAGQWADVDLVPP